MTRLLPRRALLLAPSVVTVLCGAGLLLMRERSRTSSWSPLAEAGNALVGRRLPAFTLSALPGATGFSSHDVAAAGRLVLLNFFASWCVPCLQEMPQLAALAKGGLQVWGIAYRDHPADAVGFLHRVDDPYQRIGCDLDGKAGAAFGLFGVPESFLVDRDGIVRWSWAGRLNPDVIRQDLAPLI